MAQNSLYSPWETTGPRFCLMVKLLLFCLASLFFLFFWIFFTSLIKFILWLKSFLQTKSKLRTWRRGVAALGRPHRVLLDCANVIILFFFYGWIILHYIYVPHFLYPLICWTFGCFHVLAIGNSATMNIGVHVSFWIVVVSGYMPRSRIVESYDNSRFLRNLHTVCHKWPHQLTFPPTV